MHLVLIPHCMTEILAKECKSGESTVLALSTVVPLVSAAHSALHQGTHTCTGTIIIALIVGNKNE